jgi:hypothetical protein
MKTEIIYTKDYALIVSDEQAKESDWGYIPFQGGDVKLVGKYFADDWKKVIGHRPLTDAPILEGLNLLPEFSQEKDAEEFAKDRYPYLGSERVKSEQNRHTDILRCGFKAGYDKAKETYNLTLSKLIDLYVEKTGYGMDMWGKEENQTMSIIAEIIQSIQQPKGPKYFVFTTNEKLINVWGYSRIVKISSEGQTEWMGEYIY